MNVAERFVTHEGDIVITKRAKKAKRRALGGPGSGNFGHAGRPGQVGGSSSEGWTAGGRALRPEEFEAIENYAVFSMQLNSDLRTGKPIDPAFVGKLQHLDSAVRSSTSDTRVPLYRSGPKSVYGSLQRGDVFTDKGFVSTSKSRTEAENLLNIEDMMVEISAPPGTYGIDVNRALGSKSPFEIQEEVILPRNTSFKVVSNKGGVLKVRVMTAAEVRKLNRS